MTLTCCQDHILTENIWFVWSETSYSGDERRCHRCGTNDDDMLKEPRLRIDQFIVGPQRTVNVQSKCLYFSIYFLLLCSINLKCFDVLMYQACTYIHTSRSVYEFESWAPISPEVQRKDGEKTYKKSRRHNSFFHYSYRPKCFFSGAIRCPMK